METNCVETNCVETTRALNLVRRLGADKEVACRALGVVARAAGIRRRARLILL